MLEIKAAYSTINTFEPDLGTVLVSKIYGKTKVR